MMTRELGLCGMRVCAQTRKKGLGEAAAINYSSRAFCEDGSSLDSENTGHTFFSYIPLFHTCNSVFPFFYLLTVNLHGNEDSLQVSAVLL